MVAIGCDILKQHIAAKAAAAQNLAAAAAEDAAVTGAASSGPASASDQARQARMMLITTPCAACVAKNEAFKQEALINAVARVSRTATSVLAAMLPADSYPDFPHRAFELLQVPPWLPFFCFYSWLCRVIASGSRRARCPCSALLLRFRLTP